MPEHISPYSILSLSIAQVLFFAYVYRKERKKKITAKNELEKIKDDFFEFTKLCADNFWETDKNHVFTLDQTLNKSDNFDYIGKTRWEIAEADPNEDEYWKLHLKDLEEHKAFRDFYYSHKIPTGKTKHWKISGVPVFNIDGAFTGYRGVGSELTENIEVKQRAREAHRRLFNAIETISEGFILWDAEDRLVLCNSRYREFFHPVSELAVPGTKFKDALIATINSGIFGEKTEEEKAIFIQERMNKHNNPPLEPFLVALPNNRWIQILERRTTDGGIIGIWTEVTELKRREQELIHAQKLEIIGQLTGSIAHDFNNFLAVVIGNLDILRRRVTDNESILKFVNRSLSGAQRAAALTQRLLAFSRKQVFQPRPTDIESLVSNMKELIGGCVGASISTHIDIANDVPPILVDPAQLETALLNLILNSRDAMPNGGRLSIEIRNITTKDLTGEFANINPEDFILIQIKDSGVGIPQELQQKVFEPFFTTKAIGKGSGLGLSMVENFVRHSRGQLKLQSSIGGGTNISFTIPIASATTLEHVEVENHSIDPQGNGELILVIEDEKLVRELTVSMLKDLGYETLEAGDAKEGLSILKNYLPQINLLLTDVILPDNFNGTALCHKAREIDPNLPLLLMSGYSNLENAKKEMLLLNCKLLNKPFKRSDLANLVFDSLNT
jgi:signal transduction histidine kinase/CheY-like chemotaxis protein